jgi:hypothetical protein
VGGSLNREWAAGAGAGEGDRWAVVVNTARVPPSEWVDKSPEFREPQATSLPSQNPYLQVTGGRNIVKINKCQLKALMWLMLPLNGTLEEH